MKTTTLLTFGIAAVMGFSALGASAQTAAAPAPQSTAQTSPMPGMTMNQDMAGMMQMMGQMKSQNEDMAALMKRLMDSMKVVQNEKDPAALRNKLAEHASLLEKLQSRMMQHVEMMRMMSGMMEMMKKPEAAPSQPAQDNPDHGAHHPGGETK